MATSPPEATDHDPELSRFFQAIVDLSASRHGRGPEDFLGALEALGDELDGLRRYRTDKALSQRLEAFVRKRFELVDDPSEYVLAWDEVALLSMALRGSAPLAFPALKGAVELLASNLTEPEVPALFGQALKRLRQLARQHEDRELEYWVQGVIKYLPDEA
jgi:hypothetical protein